MPRLENQTPEADAIGRTGLIDITGAQGTWEEKSPMVRQVFEARDC